MARIELFARSDALFFDVFAQKMVGIIGLASSFLRDPMPCFLMFFYKKNGGDYRARTYDLSNVNAAL